MSAVSNVPVESKSAKKRKAKAEVAPTVTSTGRDSPVADSAVNGMTGADINGAGAESAFLRELSKNIRNLHKKINASSKADAIVEQHKDVPLEQLVAEKKLNNDQKLQLMKKPQLQAQVAQLEEQQKHFQAFAQELEDKYNKEKAVLVESHEAALAEARHEATETAGQSHASQLESGLKVITGFLHAAAAKRQSEDAESEEARAFEGALLLVYQGNSSSLSTLKSLVEGNEEKVPDVEGNPLDFTFAQIKEAATKDAAALSEDTEVSAGSGVTDLDASVATETGTDPTIAHAGLTELEDTNTITAEAETETETDVAPNVAPEQTSTGDEAANAVAEASWDPQASVTSAQTATGEDWVQVPRDPAETETGASQPAPQQSTVNWADESGAAAEEKPVVSENDGFEQVRRDRGGRGRGPRGRGFDGRGRGRGRGDGYRGRGGQGRGGRGGNRGDRPAPAS